MTKPLILALAVVLLSGCAITNRIPSVDLTCEELKLRVIHEYQLSNSGDTADKWALYQAKCGDKK